MDFRGGCVVPGLIHRAGRVSGVICEKDGHSHSVTAELVVDTSGRGSQARRWLREIGFAAPEETIIGVDIAYSSAKHYLPEYNEPERLLLVLGPGPNYPNFGGIQSIES